MIINHFGKSVLTTAEEVAAYKASNPLLLVPEGASVIHEFDLHRNIVDVRWYDANGKLIPVEVVDSTVDLAADIHFYDEARSFYYRESEHRLDVAS